MALFIRTTDQTTGDTISTGDDYILREGVLVSDQDSDALLIDTTGGNAVQIGGSLFASVAAEGLKVNADNVNVNILTTGSVAGGGFGIEIIGTDASILNAGAVLGAGRRRPFFENFGCDLAGAQGAGADAQMAVLDIDALAHRV